MNPSNLEDILQMMWNGGLDWASSDDFKDIREGDQDKADEAYLTYQSNLAKKAVAQIQSQYISKAEVLRALEDKNEDGLGELWATADYFKGQDELRAEIRKELEL